MPPKEIPFTVPFHAAKTDALLTVPPTPKSHSSSSPPTYDIAVILTHGASGDHKTADLDHTAHHLANVGIPVIRFHAKTTNIVHRTKTFAAVLDFVEGWLGAGESPAGAAEEEEEDNEDGNDSGDTEVDEEEPSTTYKISPKTPPPLKILKGYILSGRSMGARASIHT
ncbi:Testis-expressed protein 30, partial [Rhizophlyctis rosea]